MIGIIIGGIVVVLLLFVALTYNGLVRLRNKVRDEASQIDVELKRRADLIPNLVETVKGYAKHEKDTLNDVIEARNKIANANTSEEALKANDELSKGLSKIFALSESYPDLKANENFLKLQEDLKDTEDKIALTRRLFNDNVLTLNNKIEMFPSNIIAKMFGFKKEVFFEAKEAEKETPKVKF